MFSRQPIKFNHFSRRYDNFYYYLSYYRISGFFRVSQILRKKGKFVHFLFCESYFLRFRRYIGLFLWHTITYIISTCFIFRKLKMVAKNAKIRLPRKNRIYGIWMVIRHSSLFPYFYLLFCISWNSWNVYRSTVNCFIVVKRFVNLIKRTSPFV
jgi:hypothetical protein